MTSTAQVRPDRPGVPAGRHQHLRHVVFIAAAAAIGGFLFGYDSSVVNGAVEGIRGRFGIASGVLAQVIAAALGVAAGAQWLANWLITVTFPSLSGWNLSGAYVIYNAFAALSIPFVLKFVPETRGRALEEMG